MSKFKVGDKVRVLPRLEGQRNQSPYYVDGMTDYAGDEFVIREICVDTGFIIIDSLWFDWNEDWLEIVKKPFTQQDLEVGMLIELDNGYVGNVLSDYVLDTMIKQEDLVAIYKPTETGFEKVWTKPKPKLYTLELPKNTGRTRFYNLIGDEDYGFDNDHNSSLCKTHFTLEEIKHLPNQDLIKVLIKKEKKQ